MTTEAFGVYLHWPFCAAKCPYCDFNSHVRKSAICQKTYALGFDREMASLRQRTGPRQVDSIFLGGGTPSLMDPATVTAILASVHRYWTVVENAEITMEANPSSVESQRFYDYRTAGINRLSLGVQALNDDALKALGRLHNADQAFRAIELARQIFPRLSFDLIYARPKQTLKSWESELNQAIDLAADHLSLYQLTIEEGTAFDHLYKVGKLTMPEPELAADLYKLTQKVTTSRGLPAYEISNHAKSGAQSRHNLIYWRYGEYIGIGPGAHGRFLEKDKTGLRTVTINQKKPEIWLAQVMAKGDGLSEEETLTKMQQAEEMLLMGLRLKEGLDLLAFEALAGQNIPQQTIKNLQEDGLLENCSNDRIAATEEGRLLLNYIITKIAASLD